MAQKDLGGGAGNNTVIGQSILISGKLTGDEDLTVQGRVEGELTLTRTLIVEPILFWYLCRAVLRSPQDVAWLVGALAGASALVAVIGLGQLVVGGAVTDVQGVRRVLGTYTSPNHFALLLGRALPFLVALGWGVPRWRVWAMAGAALCAGSPVRAPRWAACSLQRDSSRRSSNRRKPTSTPRQHRGA